MTTQQDQSAHAKVTRAVDEFTDRIQKAQHIRTRDAILAAVMQCSEEDGFAMEGEFTPEWAVPTQELVEAINSVEIPK